MRTWLNILLLGLTLIGCDQLSEKNAPNPNCTPEYEMALTMPFTSYLYPSKEWIKDELILIEYSDDFFKMAKAQHYSPPDWTGCSYDYIEAKLSTKTEAAYSDHQGFVFYIDDKKYVFSKLSGSFLAKGLYMAKKSVLFYFIDEPFHSMQRQYFIESFKFNEVTNDENEAPVAEVPIEHRFFYPFIPNDNNEDKTTVLSIVRCSNKNFELQSCEHFATHLPKSAQTSAISFEHEMRLQFDYWEEIEQNGMASVIKKQKILSIPLCLEEKLALATE